MHVHNRFRKAIMSPIYIYIRNIRGCRKTFGLSLIEYVAHMPLCLNDFRIIFCWLCQCILKWLGTPGLPFFSECAVNRDLRDSAFSLALTLPPTYSDVLHCFSFFCPPSRYSFTKITSHHCSHVAALCMIPKYFCLIVS